MKYKVGDKVKIVSERTSDMESSGAMDKYFGTVMTINNVCCGYYDMLEDFNTWCWYESMIEPPKQTPYEYLIEYYGLKKDTDYKIEGSMNNNFRTIDDKFVDGDNDAFELFDNDDVSKLMSGKAVITEIPQKKTVTLELTDEQLEQIKKIIE